MGFDMGHMFPAQTPVRPVTDLSPHVDGGPSGSAVTSVDYDDRTNLHDAAAIVAIAVILLWVAGAFSLRNHNL